MKSLALRSEGRTRQPFSKHFPTNMLDKKQVFNQWKWTDWHLSEMLKNSGKSDEDSKIKDLCVYVKRNRDSHMILGLMSRKGIFPLNFLLATTEYLPSEASIFLRKTVLNNDLVKSKGNLSRLWWEIFFDLGSCDGFCAFSSTWFSWIQGQSCISSGWFRELE